MYCLVIKELRVGTGEMEMAKESFMRSINTGNALKTRKRSQQF